jgi:phosphoglycolate phosphatase-like HAD superfamily hydrolase
MPGIDTIVFDIGNVLIEWDPRHLYRRLIPEAAEMERFLAEVCTGDWNLEQDRGRPWEEAAAERIALFPRHEALIRAFRARWHEMIPGEVPGTMALLEALRARGVPLYAITNFAADTFAEAAKRFPVLRPGGAFRDVVVSGTERGGEAGPGDLPPAAGAQRAGAGALPLHRRQPEERPRRGGGGHARAPLPGRRGAGAELRGLGLLG